MSPTASTKSGPSSTATTSLSTSRAVIRDVEAGSSTDCSHCGGRVKFQAKVRNKQVICNVYEKGRWTRVEHYHVDCYKEAGEPHGPATAGDDRRRAAANAAAAERARRFAEEAAKANAAAKAG
ncbi:MAG: hypothetical protein R2698_10540 [Microthrixaceae bacterium]